MRVLLISNSTIHGRGYLDHAEAEIRKFLGPAKTVLFFPFALYDSDGYAARASARFAEMGYTMSSVHSAGDPIKAVAETDAIFIGGGNTFKTTKDMPIVQPRSFESLGLVPFQISPHFQDPDPSSTHMGETQEERILQFLEENETPVLGMREGAWVRAENQTVVLGGSRGARIFRRGEVPVEKTTGDEISGLVGAPE
jgi:dipeptidase E